MNREEIELPPWSLSTAEESLELIANTYKWAKIDAIQQPVGQIAVRQGWQTKSHVL